MVRSINEPHTTRMATYEPVSINEPTPLDQWVEENAPGEGAKPVIEAIEPTECTIGDESFTVYLTGTGFYAQSVIVFAGHDEPTTLEADGRLSTGVNMAVWHGEDVVKVSVRNGPIMSNEVDFAFLADAGARGADPDELEDEIEQAEEEGEFKSTHKPRTKK